MSRVTSSAVACALALALSGRAAADPRVPMLSRTIMVLKDHYVDPERFEPKRMLAAGLDALSRLVDPLVVEGGEASGKIVLRMGPDAHELDLSPVTTVWSLRTAASEVLEFVEPRTSVPPADLERAFTNGLLSTLDMHTVVLGAKEANEYKTRLSGNQAAVGLVVALRSGRPVVVKVLRGTVAERMGLEKDDVLLEIAGHSTAGAELLQIVEWLRGPEKSDVEIVWSRGDEAPRRATVKREYVYIQAVSGKLLDDGVAYVRLAEFTGRAPRDLAQELKSQAARAPDGLRGVVLDLRGDGGGLFDGAQKVADLFLGSGVVVERVGPGGKVFDVLSATESDSDVTAPVVVLVDGQSAGASEIVTAALRDHDRALVVGRRTFGLGTLQQLMAVSDDGAEQLKFTIAAYRSPSGTRFDAGGLEPDVVARPGCLSDRSVRFFAPEPAAASPLGVFTYLLDAREIDPLERTRDSEYCELVRDDDRPGEDPEVAFAADVLRAADAPTRDGLRDAAARLLPKRQAAEEAKLTASLARLGIDWSQAESGEAPSVHVTAAVTPGAGASAGVPWTVTVQNTGPAPLSRLRAWTVAPRASFLDRRELVFGTIAPGAKKSFTLWLHPEGNDATPRRDEVVLRFQEENGRAPADAPLLFELTKVTRPRLTLAARVVCSARSCGRLAAPGSAEVQVSLRNDGAAPSRPDAAVQLASADERVHVVDGRFTPGSIAAGAVKRGQLALRLLDGPGHERIEVRLEAVDVGGNGTAACALELAPGTKLPATVPCGRPLISLTPEPDAAAVETTAETFALRGTVTSGAPAAPLGKVMIYLDDRKILAQAADAEGRRIAFSADLHLEPGEHLVLVSADTLAGGRETRALRVYRR